MSRPFRGYCERTTPRGDSLTMELGTDPETLKALMRKGAIKETEIRDLAREHHIPMSAVPALTWALNAMRATRPADNPLDVDGTKAASEEYRVVFERLLGDITELRRGLSKLIDAGSSGENLIRLKRDHRDIGVIDIDIRRLSNFREEATKLADYLRRWSSETSNSITWHGDIAWLVRLIEQAADKEKRKVSFTNPGADGVAFIEAVLIRAKVLRSDSEDRNLATITQALNRHKSRKRKLIKKFQTVNY
jgi:hypothetical protein